MREHTITMPQTREEIRREVQQSIQQAVRDAREAARQAARDAGQAGRDAAAASREGAVLAPAPAAPVDVTNAVALLEAQVAAANKEIGELTSQLSPSLSGAREEAIQMQLRQALSRRGELQESIDRLLTAGTPVAVQPPYAPGETIPPEVVTLSLAFFVTLAVIAIGIPLVRAFGRWLDRRGHPAPAASPEMNHRLTQIEQAIEAVAIEIERVSEGQRYTNRSISEMRGLPAPDPAGAGWPLPVREPVGVDRRSEG
jgi:hypothetical protein